MNEEQIRYVELQSTLRYLSMEMELFHQRLRDEEDLKGLSLAFEMQKEREMKVIEIALELLRKIATYNNIGS